MQIPRTVSFFPSQFRKDFTKALDYNVTFLGEIKDDPSYIKKTFTNFITVSKEI